MSPMFAFGAVLFVLCTLTVQDAQAGCYENWSRCTPQTSGGTGVLWKSCPDYCRQCKGYTSGHCVTVKNKPCSGGKQCQCTGTHHKVANPSLSCRLGL